MLNQEPPSEAFLQLTARHCAAFLSGCMPDVWFHGSSDAQHPWGTMTFVKLGEQVLVITCNHVVQHAEDTGIPAFMLALDKHTPVTSPLVARSHTGDPDYPFDVALFELGLEQLQQTDMIPLALDETPINLKEGEKVLAVGFPGYARSILGERSMVHRSCHVTVTCYAASDRRIVLHDLVPDQPEDFSVAGMSGGPIFRYDSSGIYSLVGIVSEGKGRADTSQVGGEAEGLWLSGFPVSSRLIMNLLKDRAVAHNTALHRTATAQARSRR